MKVCVFGIWHLGAVTAACLADAGFSTIGITEDPSAAKRLTDGIPPLFEPGLEQLLRNGLAAEKMSFTSDLRATADADIIWVTFDTPVEDDDRADVRFVVEKIYSLEPYLHDGTVLLVSSQLPVGTMAEIERRFAANPRRIAIAYSPENLRLGKAIHTFQHPERVVIGLRDDAGRKTLTELFAPFCTNIIWVGTEAAELSKHAINAFLATSVTFINEIAVLGEKIGADAREVEQALRSEPRIGKYAYIRPGAAIAGGTLARDVRFLSELAASNGLPLTMIGSVLESNAFHRSWPLRKLKETLGSLEGRRIGLLGLSYKPGTDATRRSSGVELGEELSRAGANVAAFDPAVKAFPHPLRNARLVGSLSDCFACADALVLMTEWPEFRSLRAEELLDRMTAPRVLDQSGFVDHLADDPRIEYFTIGRPQTQGLVRT